MRQPLRDFIKEQFDRLEDHPLSARNRFIPKKEPCEIKPGVYVRIDPEILKKYGEYKDWNLIEPGYTYQIDSRSSDKKTWRIKLIKPESYSERRSNYHAFIPEEAMTCVNP